MGVGSHIAAIVFGARELIYGATSYWLGHNTAIFLLAEVQGTISVEDGTRYTLERWSPYRMSPGRITPTAFDRDDRK
jgi:hypothetical protein